MGIFVYDFASIAKANRFLLELQKKNQLWILKGESTLNPANDFEPVRRGIKNQKYYKECMSSLIISSPGDLAVFESQFLPEYYTQRAKNFTVY